MVQKPIAISVIAAVVVAGMLTLCLAATKPLTNTAFAKTPCNLGLVWMQPKGVVLIIHAFLQCPKGTAVSGATINISAEPQSCKFERCVHASKSVTTDTGGHGTVEFVLGILNPYTIKGNYAGDSEHEPATAETIVGFR